MTLLRTTRMKIVAVAAGGLAIIGGGTAAAFAATSAGSSATSPSAAPIAAASPPPSAAPSGAAKPRHTRGLLGRADHATVEVKRNDQWETLILDRGKVTSVSAGSLTLARPDGQSVTVTLAPSTTYSGIVSSATGLQAGAVVRVTSQSGTAVSVDVRRDQPHRQPTAGAASTSTTLPHSS